MKKYASNKDINYYQFQYWVRKYNKRHINQTKQFVEVKTLKPMISTKSYKISYDKFSIELPEHFNESTLLKILKVADQVV